MSWIRDHKSREESRLRKYARLKELDLVVMDNSVRESTVGQLRGHTAEDKFKIYQEARKCGFTVWRMHWWGKRNMLLKSIHGNETVCSFKHSFSMI